MEREQQDVFRVNYPRGYMTIHISFFFPCTLQKERILYPLIYQYGEAEEIEKITSFLRWLIEEQEDEIKIIENQRSGYKEGCSRYKQLSAEIRRAERTVKQAARNLIDLEEQKVGRRRSA